ncbi:MAG: alpha-keto acid decarboxylase family protein [Gammaproteobacteria bacterium]|nr:alpha-keto acid decarboxylase family protein [Gammaproteobacteria bacterium]
MTQGNGAGARITVADHLLARLRALGTAHVFGIPGDYILPLYRRMASAGIAHVASCNELNAGYAADGYARLAGLGAVAVTCGPGALSLVNAIAGAYAERVPIVVIAGGPPARDYRTQPSRHHLLPGDYHAAVRIFEDITAAAQVLEDAASAPRAIDHALGAALLTRRPVYLEVPADVQLAACDPPAPFVRPAPAGGDRVALAALVHEIAARVRRGRTVLLPGHEVQSYGLEAAVRALVEKTGLAVASMLIGKATYLEDLPQCLGTYQGAGTEASVRQYVEGADTLLFLGAVDSDFNLGGGTATFADDQAIWIFDSAARCGGRLIPGIELEPLLGALHTALPAGSSTGSARPCRRFLHPRGDQRPLAADAPITSRCFYDRLATFFEPGDIIAADAGCAVELAHTGLPRDARMLTGLYWASIGMGFGAAFGASFAATEGARIIAVEGDGSFQMTAQELSSMARYDRRVIVFVVNNRGFTAERLIHDGPFNDVAQWRYHALPEIFGAARGLEVRTEGDLEQALAQAAAHGGPGPLLVEIHLDPFDASEVFKLMSARLRSG